MDNLVNQEKKPSLPSNTNIDHNNNNSSSNNNNSKDESSYRKLQAPTTTTTAALGRGSGGGAGSGEHRLKRDEWSEGAVSTLLEAYEAKWILRNRAKLKGQDWEDIAKYVSEHASATSTKTPKTQTQCKNKIESMKKRYRSESATGDHTSSWPLYSKLDLLLRGNIIAPNNNNNNNSSKVHFPTNQPQTCANINNSSHLTILEPPRPPPVLPAPPPPLVAPPANVTVGNIGDHNSHDSNGLDGLAKEGEGVGTKISDQESDKNHNIETDCSTPAAIYSDQKEKLKPKMGNKKKKKQKIMEEMEISESIKWLAEVIMRSEKTRLETMKELEKMRAEAEVKRGEMELKRTEIIANTQLEIAKIFAGIGKGGVDSSLKFG